MDGPTNIIIEKEFGGKKKLQTPEKKGVQKPTEEIVSSGNLIIDRELGGVKKKEDSNVSPSPSNLSSVGSKAELSGSDGQSTSQKSNIAVGAQSVDNATPDLSITPTGGKAGKVLEDISIVPIETNLTNISKRVSNFDASLKDIETLYRKYPNEFEVLRQNIAPDVTKESVALGKNQEDNFLWRVYTSYKNEADKGKADNFRYQAAASTNNLAKSLPLVSAETGKQYQIPKSLPEAQNILSDIEQKRDILEFSKDAGGLEGFVEYVQNKKQFEDNISKVMPPLKNEVSKLIFEQEAATNPNVSPYEVGKKIYQALYPKQYKLFELAGGDKIYRAGGGFGQGYAESPKYADQVNRAINEFGINAFQLYGNKAARDAAEVDAKSLGWKYTLPLEEETKHMIAAKLKEGGINPRKASEEQKDAAAETLPYVNRDVWFDKNKSENNVSLPSTGFGYSTKNSYYNTVEDGAKSLIGWMMPNRTRERALSVLKDQTASETIGENPESVQRLTQLREKEDQGTLTPTEKKEKSALEKYTDIRSGWDKFKDLSGMGVGQFAGFGTIAAFTGGLGNAKNAAGAVRALISPAADRGGMLAAGYLMSFEQNAEESTRLFPGEKEGIKRFVFSNVASGIDTFVERLFPEEKFLSGVLKKDIARLIPNLTESNLRKELNAGLAEKISKTIVKGIVQQQKTPIQEGAEEILSAQFKSMFQGMIDPDSEPVTFGELIDIGTQAYLSTQLLGVPKGLMAQRNKTVPLNAIWDAAADPEQNVQVKVTIQDMLDKKELTQEQANERISLLNTASKTYKDNPVLSGYMGGLSLPAKQNYLARLLNEKLLDKKSEETTDEILQKQYSAEIRESKKVREGIYTQEIATDAKNEEIPQTEDRWKEKIAAARTEEEKEAIMSQHGDWLIEQQKQQVSQKVPRETLAETNRLIQTAIDEGTITGMNVMSAEAALQSEENADLFLKEISDQALNKIAPDVADAGEAMDRAKSTYGEALVKAAIEKYPVESKISPQSEVPPPSGSQSVSSAVIEINGKIYEGKNHAEAILKAKADGQDISQVNRQAQGKFRLSDGTIIDRAEARSRFGQDRSELLIEQDEAADQANKDYRKITDAQSSGSVGGGDVALGTAKVEFTDEQKQEYTQRGFELNDNGIYVHKGTHPAIKKVLNGWVGKLFAANGGTHAGNIHKEGSGIAGSLGKFNFKTGKTPFLDLVFGKDKTDGDYFVTLSHEMGHGIFEKLTPEERAIIEKNENLTESAKAHKENRDNKGELENKASDAEESWSDYVSAFLAKKLYDVAHKQYSAIPKEILPILEANIKIPKEVLAELGKEQTPSLQQDPSIKEGASKGKVGEVQKTQTNETTNEQTGEGDKQGNESLQTKKSDTGKPLEDSAAAKEKAERIRKLKVEEPAPAPKISPKPKQKRSNTAANEARKVYRDIGEVDDPVDARGAALAFLAGGGKINEQSFNDEVAGSVKRASLNTGAKDKKTSEAKSKDYVSKDAKGIDEIAHSIWEGLPEEVRESITTQDIRNELIDVANSHNTRLSAAIEFRDRYIVNDVRGNFSEAELKEMNDLEIAKRSKIVEGLPEQQQKDLLQLIEKYEDRYGNVDWEKLEKDTNGFSADILSLPVETQDVLDAIIQKNISQAASESNNATDKDGSSQKEIAEEKLKAAQSSYNKAAAELKKAEDEISKKQVGQTDIFAKEPMAMQKEMFAGRDDLKTILDPLRQKIRETKSELDAAQKEFDRENESVADKVRNLKIDLGDGGLQSNIAGVPIALYNAAIETIALAVEGGMKIAEAINKAIKDHKLDKQKDFDKDNFVKKIEEATGETVNEATEEEITPPITPAGKETDDEFENKPKSILNRINNSKNVSDSFKEKFKSNPKDLRYDPQSHEVARQLAKEIVDEFGTEDAVAMAESGRFDGDVNSMIFAESIDRTYQQEQDATTQAEKIKFAEQWADYAIRYDETARQKGKFISAIYDFYKKSPLGVVLSERAKRDMAFKEWFQNKEGGYKEVFEAIKDEPEFKEFVSEKVKEGLKEERQTVRQKRRAKITEIFDKGKIKGDNLSSSLIPPGIWNAAVELMKQTYLAGERIAYVIEQGINYIKTNYKEAWDEKAFTDEWNERLSGIDGNKIKTDEDTQKKKQERILDRFRKKLSGLSDQQKEDVIRKSFKKLVENRALEYDEFKKIIADVLGLGEMTAEEITKLNGLLSDINAVQDAADNVMNQEKPEDIKNAIRNFDVTAKKAEHSAKKLAGMLYNKPDVGQRIRSMVQLNTLGIFSLIKNVGYNVFNQLFVRIPKAIYGTAIDQAIYGLSFLANKISGSPIIKPDVNIFLAQKGYFSKGAEGGAKAIKQIFTGLTNKDYFQKEVYTSQIKPWTSIKDLWNWGRGNKFLSKAQIADKALQATVGIPAEIIARGLNIGDKPFRDASAGAAATTIGKQQLGLKGIELERFVRFPKEAAKRVFILKGMKEEEATKKAEGIESRIISEGEQAVFQQDNIINDVLNGLKNTLKPKDGSHPLAPASEQLVRTIGLLNLPYVKTPVNIMWEFFNLMNPEIALFQSFIFGIKAAKSGSREDFIKSKKWLSHAATGYSILAATAYMASIGALGGDDDDEAYKAKEAKGKATYEKPHTINYSKLQRAGLGESTETQDGDVMVDLSWLGPLGSVMNFQANKYENMTDEERERMGYVDDLLMRLQSGARDGLVNTTFRGAFDAVDAITSGRTDNWILNMMNVATNLVEPATIAQISRQNRKEEYQVKGDTFSEKLENSMKARFFGKLKPKKNVWGENIEKGNPVKSMLGVYTYNGTVTNQPIHKDFKRTGNADFYPPALSGSMTVDGVSRKMNTEQLLQMETLVGQARKTLSEPFVNGSARIGGKRYKDMSDDEKLDALKDIYTQGYNVGKAKFVELYPEFQKKKKE